MHFFLSGKLYNFFFIKHIIIVPKYPPIVLCMSRTWHYPKITSFMLRVVVLNNKKKKMYLSRDFETFVDSYPPENTISQNYRLASQNSSSGYEI